MKIKPIIFVLFLGVALSSCFTKKKLIQPYLDSNRNPLPIEASEVIAEVLEVVQLEQAILKSSPCAKAPCKAKIKIRQILSEEDIAYNKRFDEEGFVGHPAGFEWFCDEHYKLAEKFTDLTLSEAITRINKALLD